MKDDFRDILRGTFIFETPISVDGGCEVRNLLRWQVSTQFESTLPTSTIRSGACDCQCPSVDRETECIPLPLVANDGPWIDYHVGMWKLHIQTVASIASSKGCNNHDD